MDKKQIIKKKITKNGDLLNNRISNNGIIKKNVVDNYKNKEKKDGRIEVSTKVNPPSLNKKGINMNYNRYQEKKLGIIIVNLNNLSYTQNLIVDLQNQINKNFHVHIYDQNSDEEGTDEYLNQLNKETNIDVVWNGDNIPLNHLWNEFVDTTEYEYICFLNNDVNITNNFVDDTIKCLDNNQDVGIVIHPTNNSVINKSNHIYELNILENPPLYQGWDFSFRRSAFEKIPLEMLIFGGDDFIFANVIDKGFKIGMTMSSPIIHYKERTRVKIPNIRQIQTNDAAHYWKEMKIRGLKHVGSTMTSGLSNKYPPNGMKLIQNKKCIYTAVIGDYDTLYESNTGKKEGWDYICFTDNKDLVSDFWRVIYIGNNKKDELSNYKLARYFKTNYHKYLSSYDHIIWKDARCIINCDLDEYLSLLGDNDIIFSDHAHRNNILQEMSAVLSGKLEDASVINKMKEKYNNVGYKYDNGLMSSGLLCFRNNETMINFFMDWWNEINLYSYRDQLSLNYVLSKHNNIKYTTINFFRVFAGYFIQGKRKSPRLTY